LTNNVLSCRAAKRKMNSGSASEENIRKGIARLGKVLKKFCGLWQKT
jgi:hypothetical protein